MITASANDWIRDFGLETRQPPSLFTSKDQLKPATPQAHLLRRAFESLAVDAVLCVDHSPLIYFKQVGNITVDGVYELDRRFWNHGGAPILVLITDADVHVYSGMSRPGQNVPSGLDELPSHIETLRRVAGSLREFLTAVESGEYFHRHQGSFEPAQRVDRELLDDLQAARAKLQAISGTKLRTQALDSLLCRLVFTCYLFDREIIDKKYLDALGIAGVGHLREVLAIRPQASARSTLYKIFEKLKIDFNGDLFSDDLASEAQSVLDEHIAVLSDFFPGTSGTGQRRFWPYNFAYVPIETISAIYERFLSDSDENVGAFYTPRLLAEVVIDVALAEIPTLLGKRCLDPACGSGIFLVGLFNRIAEEWKQANPGARNDRKAKKLQELLQTSLFGVDVNPTACRITAFSLYLAYLDQLSQRGIQELQERGHFLPRLFVDGGNIQHADFFTHDAESQLRPDIVIGNPPWGSLATAETAAGKWCNAHGRQVPDMQIAAAFAWKAAEDLADGGRVCLVLPHGLLFNHSATALRFQREWGETHALDCVVNLADLRYFLFEKKAIHPAIIVRYQKAPPKDGDHRISYWAPKADWTATKARVITIAPQDRTDVTVGEVFRDLDGPDAPQIWKRRFWATPRDWRLLDRLLNLPRLRDIVRQSRERSSSKPWLISEGFQPLGGNDDPERAKTITLPSSKFIKASSARIDLFLLDRDCEKLDSVEIKLRNKSNTNTRVFRRPHVIIAKGFSRIAFADFNVSFRHALRGIQGPKKDRDLLAFLAAYLLSSVARYFLFHTSTNWGIYRPEVHVEEVLRAPFPLPEQHPNPKRGWEIVHDVAKILTDATRSADVDVVDRQGIVRNAIARIEPLMDEYFDVLPLERLLIDDTLNVTIKSIQPTPERMPVETVKPTSLAQLGAYCRRVCEMLNGWAKRGKYSVRGTMARSDALGIALAAFEKVPRGDKAISIDRIDGDLLAALDELRKAAPQKFNTVDLVRGVMAFLGNRLYLVKPIGRRYWTQTAAMNDADEIAGTILMRTSEDA